MRSALLAIVVTAALITGACRGDDAATTATPASTDNSTARQARALVIAESDPEPERPPRAIGMHNASTSSSRALTELAIGDCVNLHGLSEPDTVEVTTVSVKDCGEPHDAEVFARISLNDEPADPYPGDTDILSAADQVCLTAFEPYVGSRYVDTRLEIVHLRPTEASWLRDDRTVVCALVNANLGPLVGSVAGGP